MSGGEAWRWGPRHLANARPAPRCAAHTAALSPILRRTLSVAPGPPDLPLGSDLVLNPCRTDFGGRPPRHRAPSRRLCGCRRTEAPQTAGPGSLSAESRTTHTSHAAARLPWAASAATAQTVLLVSRPYGAPYLRILDPMSTAPFLVPRSHRGTHSSTASIPIERAKPDPEARFALTK